MEYDYWQAIPRKTWHEASAHLSCLLLRTYSWCTEGAQRYVCQRSHTMCKPKFRWIPEHTRRKFEMKANEELPAEFTGPIVSKENDVSFDIDQSHYIRKLECLPSDTSFKHFSSLRMGLAWLPNSRTLLPLRNISASPGHRAIVRKKKPVDNPPTKLGRQGRN